LWRYGLVYRRGMRCESRVKFRVMRALPVAVPCRADKERHELVRGSAPLTDNEGGDTPRSPPSVPLSDFAHALAHRLGSAIVGRHRLVAFDLRGGAVKIAVPSALVSEQGSRSVLGVAGF
jgi:hypothetical protein